jgi:hypothetical protein
MQRRLLDVFSQQALERERLFMQRSTMLAAVLSRDGSCRPGWKAGYKIAATKI